MAGFFGFLDFTKEGPGVSKDAPKKKAFFAFFELFFRNFWSFFSINLTYCLTSILIVTHGFAEAGITHVTRNIARGKHSFGLSDYFETIKKNWKQALSVGIINTLVSAINLFAIEFYNASYIETGKDISLAGLVVSVLIFVVFTMMKYYMYTLMITFDFKLMALYKNSFKFVIVNFWKTLLCGICIIATYALFIGIPLLLNSWLALVIAFILWAAIFPAFEHLLIQFFTFGSIKKYIIDPYYKEHPEADIEKRRNLGLDVPEDDDDDEEGPISWE